MKARLRRWLRRGLAAGALLALVGGLGLYAAARAVPLPEGFLAPGSQVVTFADGSFAHVFLSPDDKWRIAVHLDEIDPAYVQALLRLEDERFYAHPGVDPVAIVRAAVTNLRRGRVVSGASTLTMQLVRVREPRPRTLTSKVVEAFRALQVEARYDKRQILEAYLQYVPYGRNLEGVEAAALAYFGHRATALSPAEIATLLAVPQNPNRRFPHPDNAARLRAARDDIAARLSASGALGDAPALADTPAPMRLARFPRLAPHAAYWLVGADDAPRIRTTLDRGLQAQAEAVMAGAAGSLRAKDIAHGAIVVIEHGTGRVRALVGAGDFWAGAAGAQIASFDVPRSPGSALKPFIYALALDRGEVLPEHLVLDVPVQYGTYVPKNYDGRFAGLVRAETALSKSLNVPFVDMLAEIGVDRFTGHLETWGVRSLSARPGYYGLSAAIGGLELTPLELAGLYAMVGRGGAYVTPTWRQDAETTTSRGLSPGASFLVQRALRLRDRPDFPERRRFTGAPSNIHWKTGTSYGHRDAWAAGSGPTHTAVVWLGNLDQTPSSHLVGAAAAGPILFDVLEGLAPAAPPDPPKPPGDLARVEVCRYSGHRPGPGCRETKWVWAKRDSVPTEGCPYHVALEIDVASGLAVSPDCRAGRVTRVEAFLAWPSSLRRWLAAESRHAPHPPAYAPGCANTGDAGRLRILSPERGQLALLMPGVPETDQEIPLMAETSAAEVSWFVDGAFLGTVPAQQRLWWTPSPGRHEIVATDPHGRTAQQRLQVARR